MPQITQIQAQDAYNRLQNGALLLDVREADEVRELSCDVPETLHVPMSQFQSKLQTLPKEREIITVCYSGARSFVATQLLVAHGYTQVSNLAGGMSVWQREGLPLKK